MIGVLRLDEAAAKARAIADFAAKRENWYVPNQSPVPGDIADHVLLNGGVRAVFAWTVTPIDVRRHLSVAVGRASGYPQPLLVWTLCHFFGFTGAKVESHTGTVLQPAKSWLFVADEDAGCVVVQEVISEIDPSPEGR